MNHNGRTFLVGVHGPAVGSGIARSIRANAGGPASPEAWVHFCLTAADEAHAAVMESPPLDAAAEHEGSAALMLRELAGRYPAPGDDVDIAPPPRLVGKSLLGAAQAAAQMAFRCCMPKLTGRRNVQAYIACVAAGTQRAYFTGSEARALLYTSQLALAAYPKRISSSRPVARKKAGFQA